MVTNWGFLVLCTGTFLRKSAWVVMVTKRFPMIDYHLDVFHWLPGRTRLPVVTHYFPDITCSSGGSRLEVRCHVAVR